MKLLNTLTRLLVIGAAGNWALTALYHDDILMRFLGDSTLLSQVVYGAVGLAALWQFVPLVESIVGRDR